MREFKAGDRVKYTSNILDVAIGKTGIVQASNYNANCIPVKFEGLHDIYYVFSTSIELVSRPEKVVDSTPEQIGEIRELEIQVPKKVYQCILSVVIDAGTYGECVSVREYMLHHLNHPAVTIL